MVLCIPFIVILSFRFLQALLNSLEKTVHRDLQFAELHALQGVLQQLDFQQTSTQDGSWGVLALHADRVSGLHDWVSRSPELENK